MILAIGFGLAAAICFALASVLQQRAAKQQERRRVLDPRLLARLSRTRLWLFGWIPDGAAVVLQALALRYGPLTLVQPLLTSGLFLAVLIEAPLDRRRVRARELTGITVGLLGVAAFLIAADPGAGVTQPSARAWYAVAAGAGLAITGSVLASLRVPESARAALLGVATGVAYGVAAALLKAVVSRYHGSLPHVLLDWRTVLLVLVALLGMLLNQNAFQSGRIAAPLTALTLTNPITSVIIGLTAFREMPSVSPPRIVVLGVAAIAIACGVVLTGLRNTDDGPG